MHGQLHHKISLVVFVSIFSVCALQFIAAPKALAQECVNGQIVMANADGTTTVVPNSTCAAQGDATQGGALTRGGVFGCTGAGARVANVGATAAIGGVYVPVNDAAVTLNTGYLVYKECVLDAVVKRAAENGTVQLTQQGIRAMNSGRDGSPWYSQSRAMEEGTEAVIIAGQVIDESNAGVLCPAFKNTVRTAVLRNFELQRNRPNASFACSMPTNSNSFFQNLAALRESRNNPWGAYQLLEDQLEDKLGYNDFDQRQRLQRNNGYYDQVDNPNDPLGARITTPGYVLSQSFQQMLGSGFRQLETANEIDQIVGNLWSGLNTNILSNSGGVLGLMEARGGQPSYISRMGAESAQGVRDQTINAAIAVLNGAFAAERQYKAAKEAIATAIIAASAKLKAAEQVCWNLIIPKVQERAAQGSCTTDDPPVCSGGVALTIATSTVESQRIITGQLSTTGTRVSNEIRDSQTALTLMTAIATAVTLTTSPAGQQQALLQLDQLLQAGRVHSASDAQAAVAQRDSVVQAINVLVEDTITAWGDSPDLNIGWCNVNNTAVVDRWFNAWRQ